MKKKFRISKTLLNLTLIFVYGITYSQIEIRGQVTSEFTKKPLHTGYSIKPNIEEHPTSFSDENGEYLIEYLEPNKEYEIVLSAFGYEDQVFRIKTNDSITYRNFVIKSNCNWDDKAQTDWDNFKGKFLLTGGFIPIINSKSDNRFEKKYKIKYFDYGCVQPNRECINMYNRKIAELMDDKFGKEWREKAREDIVGL